MCLGNCREMEGKKEEGVRKGPWKAEEDQVLINHVNKYGPRDWSSIRSKGLLQRTGKSCRLRWVNKLRPNLKNGCKFSLEEERVVIELQAQFGNKWARIATYLPGRTDNDVKNFWSSRQKRLAKILQTTPSSSSSSKSHKNKREVPLNHEVPTFEAPTFISSSEGESLKVLPESSSNAIKMVPLPDLVNQELLIFKPDLFQSVFCPPLENLHIDSQPLNPFLQPPQHQPDLTFSSENQDLMDPYFDMFGSLDASKFGYGTQLPIGPPFIEPVDGKENLDNCSTPDCFFDDFPTDMFDDQIDSLPSPSDQ